MAARFITRTFWILLAVGIGVYGSISAWKLARVQQEDAVLTLQKMQAAQTEKADLLMERARRENPSGREELARSKGYIKEGEVRLEIR